MKARGEERAAGNRHSAEGATLWVPARGFSPPCGKEEEDASCQWNRTGEIPEATCLDRKR